jgi:TM2 domain-containing membrane protein YozV
MVDMDATPGWYSDPEQPNTVRWWTGAEWTPDRRAASGYPPATAPPVVWQQQIPGADKKLPAGILGILLGGFGVHRFYLGDVSGGLLRILITFLTCGMGSIIGFIEGIIYLTKSDQEFVQVYLIEGREWF